MYPLDANATPSSKNKQWLEMQLKTRSVRDIAKELGVAHMTLRSRMDRLGIVLSVVRDGIPFTTKGKRGPRSPFKVIITKEDLLREYVNKDVSMSDAATALGCSIKPFFEAMKEHGIVARPRGKRPQPHAGIPELADAAWLAEELRTKTLTQVALELHTSHKNVATHAKVYGITFHHEFRAAAVREGLRQRFPNGRRGTDAANWQGGRKETSASYIYIYSPLHPHATKSGYVLEHRLVMEEKLGRLLDPKEHVHHINGDRRDNRPENLAAMTHAEHTRAHFDAVKELELVKQQLAEAQAYIARSKAVYGPLPEEETRKARVVRRKHVIQMSLLPLAHSSPPPSHDA